MNLLASNKGRTSSKIAEQLLPGVKRIIAVASGKGGVGKSTVTANLACALHASGATVGVLDADVYGPSLPKMFGVERPPISVTEDNQLIPWNHEGIKIMSMGFLVDEKTPVIWRGPMVHNLLSQFFKQVVWGDLDYLLLDLPPGTGDAQLTITQTVPLAGAIIVTTPQEVAIQIASKGLQMFGEVNVPILGFVENMSYYECVCCHERTEPFRSGGTKRAAEMYKVPFLGQIPLDPQITLDGDSGRPTVISHPTSPAAEAYRALASAVTADLAMRPTAPGTSSPTPS